MIGTAERGIRGCPVGALPVVLGLAAAAACGGADRQPAVAEDAEPPAPARSQIELRGDATAGDEGDACRLGPWARGGDGLELRLPRAGLTVPGWSLGRLDGDRAAALETLSGAAAGPVQQTRVPLGTVHYTVEEQRGPGAEARSYLVLFTFQHGERWYRGQIPIQGRSRHLVESCLDLIPESLASLRAAD